MWQALLRRKKNREKGSITEEKKKECHCRYGVNKSKFNLVAWQGLLAGCCRLLLGLLLADWLTGWSLTGCWLADGFAAGCLLAYWIWVAGYAWALE